MSARDGDPLDDALTGAIAAGLKPAQPDRATAARLRDRLLAAARAGRADFQGHLTIRAAEGAWIAVAPGIHMKLLREDDLTRSYLLRMSPGAVVPGHDHALDEECLILEGEVWLGELRASAGDFHLARRGLAHGELRTATGCLLYLRGQRDYGIPPPADVPRGRRER